MRAVIPIAAACLLLGGCASTPAVDQQVESWRQILAREAPVGAPAATFSTALARRGLTASRGTYLRLRDDGTRAPGNCPDPRAALTARERGVERAFGRLEVEITACLDAAGRIERHRVAVWNLGI